MEMKKWKSSCGNKSEDNENQPSCRHNFSPYGNYQCRIHSRSITTYYLNT